MARKKLSLLVQAMNLFAQLDERDKQTLADYVKSQTNRASGGFCGACDNTDYKAHFHTNHPNYHAFVPVKKIKGASA